MRIRLTFDRIVLLDISLLEPEADDADPAQVVDMSTGHDIGFSAVPGWHEPKEAEGRSGRSQ